MTIEIKEKPIFTKRIAYELRREGCKLLRVEPNWTKPQFDVYIFEEDDRFSKAMEKLNS